VVQLGWVRTLRESGLKIKKLKEHGDGAWEVDLSESEIRDLAILHEAPVGELQLWNTAVADLTPLPGMTLKRRSLFDTKVVDLKVADVSALRGMPLKSLRLHNCAELIDLSPLAECKELEEVPLRPNATNIDCRCRE
jgi:hypothetical protein